MDFIVGSGGPGTARLSLSFLIYKVASQNRLMGRVMGMLQWVGQSAVLGRIPSLPLTGCVTHGDLWTSPSSSVKQMDCVGKIKRDHLCKVLHRVPDQ